MAPRAKRNVGRKMRDTPGRYILPGVGDGLVDPEFDDFRSTELELREHLGAHDRSEDYD